jgi:hypothetical protein
LSQGLTACGAAKMLESGLRQCSVWGCHHQRPATLLPRRRSQQLWSRVLRTRCTRIMHRSRQQARLAGRCACSCNGRSPWRLTRLRWRQLRAALCSSRALQRRRTAPPCSSRCLAACCCSNLDPLRPGSLGCAWIAASSMQQPEAPRKRCPGSWQHQQGALPLPMASQDGLSSRRRRKSRRRKRRWQPRAGVTSAFNSCASSGVRPSRRHPRARPRSSNGSSRRSRRRCSLASHVGCWARQPRCCSSSGGSSPCSASAWGRTNRPCLRCHQRMLPRQLLLRAWERCRLLHTQQRHPSQQQQMERQVERWQTRSQVTLQAKAAALLCLGAAAARRQEAVAVPRWPRRPPWTLRPTCRLIWRPPCRGEPTPAGWPGWVAVSAGGWCLVRDACQPGGTVGLPALRAASRAALLPSRAAARAACGSSSPGRPSACACPG